MYVWADASKEIGYGHFTRSLALVDMLKENFDCIFFTQSPTSYQKEEVLKICKLVELPSTDDKFSLFLDFLSGDEIVVLDNYFFSSDYQKRIKDKGCKLVCIGANDRHYYADILFNYVENNSSVFSIEPYTQVCLGIEWMLLREPFLINWNQKKREKLSAITICFGGTDQFELTECCISIIKNNFTIDRINLIATSSFEEKRIKSLKEKGISCYIDISAREVAEVFSKTDCAIVSASTVAQEALACGVIVLCGYYVSNQEKMYRKLLSEGCIVGLGNLLDDTLEKRLNKALVNYSIYNAGLRRIDYTNLKEKYISKFKELC